MVKVGESWSEPRSVNGGVSQGYIMGIFLFNATTDDLEESGEAVDIVDSNENSSGSICTSSTSVDGVPASVQDSSAATSTPVAGRGDCRMVGLPSLAVLNLSEFYFSL